MTAPRPPRLGQQARDHGTLTSRAASDLLNFGHATLAVAPRGGETFAEAAGRQRSRLYRAAQRARVKVTTATHETGITATVVR